MRYLNILFNKKEEIKREDEEVLPYIEFENAGQPAINDTNLNNMQKLIKQDIQTNREDVEELIETFTGTENATSGYCKLNNGLILQWGSVNANTFLDDSETGGKQKVVAFPIPFTKFNQCFCTFQYKNGRETASIKEFNLNAVTLVTGVNIANVKVNWFAIGM